MATQGTAGGLATGDTVQGILAQGALGHFATCVVQPVLELAPDSGRSSALQPSEEAASSGWQVSDRKGHRKRCKKTGQPSLEVEPKGALASGGEISD